MTRKIAVFLAIATVAMVTLSACGLRTTDTTRGRIVRRNTSLTTQRNTTNRNTARNDGMHGNDGMMNRDRDGFVDTNRDGRQDGIVRDGVVRENDRRHDTARNTAPRHNTTTRQGETLPHRQTIPHTYDDSAGRNDGTSDNYGVVREDRMARDHSVTRRHTVTPRERYNNRANTATPRVETSPSATMAPRQGYVIPRAPGAAPRVAQSPAPGGRNATPMRPL